MDSDRIIHWVGATYSFLKVGFSQKVMAKFSNFSNCHSCEPKIVPILLIPVHDNNIILAILWIVVVIKSPRCKIWLKWANFMGRFNCLQCLQSYEIINYNMSTYLYQFQETNLINTEKWVNWHFITAIHVIYRK